MKRATRERETYSHCQARQSSCLCLIVARTWACLVLIVARRLVVRFIVMMSCERENEVVVSGVREGCTWLCAEWLHCQAEIMTRQTIGCAETWESSTLTTPLSEFLTEFEQMAE
jgi:hypothetical protein